MDVKNTWLWKLSYYTLKAALIDSLKVIYKIFNKPKNKYGIVYEDGALTKGWV
jgi:hypothetical protein